MPDRTFIVVAFVSTILLISLLMGFMIVLVLLNQKRQEILRGVYDKELLKSQLEMQESTLKKISQEIHDNIGQHLTVLKLYLATRDISSDIQHYSTELLTRAIEDIRDLSKSLSLELIRTGGLPSAIECQLEQLRKTGTYQINYSVAGTNYFLDERAEIFLFRILQEALTNIIRHADASLIAVQLDCRLPGSMQLSISDNGHGFELEDQTLRGKNLRAGGGISHMLARVQLLGGHFHIDSCPRKGTTITITIRKNG